MRDEDSSHAITVIIPTTCETSRLESLNKAIGSVRSSGDMPVRVLVVVNGTRFDPAGLDALRARLDVTVAYLEQGSLPNALRHGRGLVQTTFFSFLDDDDEYTPDALQIRLAPLHDDPTVDFVATNGWRDDGQQRRLAISDTDLVLRDPLEALLRSCWLASCGGLYRTATIGPEFFDGAVKHLEWTALAFRLSIQRKLAFIDQPTFVINENARSLSASPAYRVGIPQALESIQALPLPARLRPKLRRKIARAHFDAAVSLHESGQWRPALTHFFKSLHAPSARHGKLLLNFIVGPLRRRRAR